MFHFLPKAGLDASSDRFECSGHESGIPLRKKYRRKNSKEIFFFVVVVEPHDK